ncbi:MAG TPA: hemerythrin domain-containing protein [Mycobacteriales bacterium]|nr:hemerythrin domain-containing protein [Mycobacteriales bacterium]
MSVTTTGDAIAAVTTHHRHLRAAVDQRVDVLAAAARAGEPHQPAVHDLHQLLTTEVAPHARAEEEVLYAAAGPTLRPLVAGMIFEHETLRQLIAELDPAPDAADAVGVARAIREIFTGHVRRENELLLPALAADPGVDLVMLLPVMERRFAEYQAAATAQPS